MPGGRDEESHGVSGFPNREAAGDGAYHRGGGADCAAQRRKGWAVLCVADAHHGGSVCKRLGKRADRRHRQVAGGVGAGPARLQAPPDRRGQWRCASEVALAASRTHSAGDRRQARPGYMAARLLCRIRWPASQACDYQGAGGGVSGVSSVNRGARVRGVINRVVSAGGVINPAYGTNSAQSPSVILRHAPVVTGKLGVEKSILLLGSTTRSTRRFSARPSTVSLLATGGNSAYPAAEMRSAGMGFISRKIRAMCVARADRK